MKLSEFLRRRVACREGTSWVRRLGFKRAYLAAKRAAPGSSRRDWLDWFGKNLSGAAELDTCWCQYCDGPPPFKVAAATLRRLK